jgi:predicted GIY-YIG superfamily endonuclease
LVFCRTLSKEEEERERGTGRSMVYCCYLLTSANPRFEKHTYIGFTVNPARRLRQHNGELVNGALKTHSKRPWRMVVVCHGFPNKADALKFEWAWQNPTKSKKTKEMAKGLKRVGGQYFLKAKIRYLMEMLQIPPWRRFQLSLTWLTREYTGLLAGCPDLPKHMAEAYAVAVEDVRFGGEVEGDDDDDPNVDPSVLMDDLRDDSGGDGGVEEEPRECSLCHEDLMRYRRSRCGAVSSSSSSSSSSSTCPMYAHVICLASHFLRSETPLSSRHEVCSSPKLMPTAGTCPVCYRRMNWSEVVHHSRGLTEKDRKRKREDDDG